MTSSFFITGTDTNVGKTVVACALSKKYKVHYWKPIQSGFQEGSDSDFIASIIGSEWVLPEIYKLKAPLVPILSAEQENIHIDIKQIKKAFIEFSKPLIVEGAGGLLVPLTRKDLIIDLVNSLEIPTIIVARTSLGTINHTLLSIEAIRSKNIKLAGIILVGKRDFELEGILIYFGKVKILGSIPIMEELNKKTISEISKMIEIDLEVL